jgi:hypothetical protein
MSKLTDRQLLEQGQARELFRTWESTKEKVLTPVRLKYLKKLYGSDGVERIIGYMQRMKSGDLL